MPETSLLKDDSRVMQMTSANDEKIHHFTTEPGVRAKPGPSTSNGMVLRVGDMESAPAAAGCAGGIVSCAFACW